ncbi:hypothetical protein GCM10027403_12890 [Arthrobacter tecti]
MENSLTLEQIIGKNVESFRIRRGLSQSELGRKLEPFTGKPWSRQAVSQAEAGRRSYAAADLFALCLALGESLADLFVAPPGIEWVETPAGKGYEMHVTAMEGSLRPFGSKKVDMMNWVASGEIQALLKVEDFVKLRRETISKAVNDALEKQADD